jgi:ATP-dependent DNA helicase Q1
LPINQKKILVLNLPKFVLFKASFNRPNIYYEVKQKPSNHDECMNEIAKLIKERFSNQSGIVYCFSQRETEQVAHDLASRQIKAGFYHANMDATERYFWSSIFY